jgi:hypothetical protein
MFPIFLGWSLRRLAVVTYETDTRSVAVNKQWTVYTTGFRRHATILSSHLRLRLVVSFLLTLPPNPVCIPILPICATCSTHLIFSELLIIILFRRVQFMKLLHMRFSSASYYLTPLMIFSSAPCS